VDLWIGRECMQNLAVFICLPSLLLSAGPFLSPLDTHSLSQEYSCSNHRYDFRLIGPNYCSFLLPYPEDHHFYNNIAVRRQCSPLQSKCSSFNHGNKMARPCSRPFWPNHLAPQTESRGKVGQEQPQAGMP
jgi:hypothetical protein